MHVEYNSITALINDKFECLRQFRTLQYVPDCFLFVGFYCPLWPNDSMTSINILHSKLIYTPLSTVYPKLLPRHYTSHLRASFVLVCEHLHNLCLRPSNQAPRFTHSVFDE